MNNVYYIIQNDTRTNAVHRYDERYDKLTPKLARSMLQSAGFVTGYVTRVSKHSSGEYTHYKTYRCTFKTTRLIEDQTEG